MPSSFSSPSLFFLLIKHKHVMYINPISCSPLTTRRVSIQDILLSSPRLSSPGIPCRHSLRCACHPTLYRTPRPTSVIASVPSSPSSKVPQPSIKKTPVRPLRWPRLPRALTEKAYSQRHLAWCPTAAVHPKIQNATNRHGPGLTDLQVTTGSRSSFRCY